MKHRLDDCFSHPVTGVPGRSITLLDRTTNNYNTTFHYPGSCTRTLNISSYNYLGFAQARGGCADAAEECVRQYGLTAMGARRAGGTLDLHVQAERLVARFIGQEDAAIVSMGFATNSTNIPALVGRGCLVISDELNHASIRTGVRISGAQVRMYKHNDMRELEKLLREVISQGQPKTHRPWKKILVVVEGLFSMEGTFCNLPALIELKKRYKVRARVHCSIHFLAATHVCSSSSTSMLTKPIPSVRLVQMGAACATILVSTLGTLTFSWAHSPNPLARRADIFLVQRNSSTPSGRILILGRTLNPSVPWCLHRSWLARPLSWASHLIHQPITPTRSRSRRRRHHPLSTLPP